MSDITEPRQSVDTLNAEQTIDAAVRKLLKIPKVKNTAPQERGAERLFSFAMLISALRCTLSYVILPFVIPALGLGASTSIGPQIGIPIGLIALYYDIKGIRRFWIANHRLKWQMTIIYLLVIALVTYLVVNDLIRLL